MKKIILNVAFLSCSTLLGVNSLHADINSMMKEAFPKSYFGACNAKNAEIRWDTVASIEKQGPESINTVGTYVMKNILPCIKNTNPNFVNKLKESCSTSLGSQNQIKTCSYVGIQLRSESDQPVQQTNLQMTKIRVQEMIEQALPKSRNFFDRCSQETGRINWAMVKQLEENGQSAALQSRFISVTEPCLSTKNTQMLGQIASTCETNLNSPLQKSTCDTVARVLRQPNAVSQSLSQQMQQGQTQNPVMGIPVNQQQGTVMEIPVQSGQNIPSQSVMQNPLATPADCSAIEAEFEKYKADVAAYKEKMIVWQKELSEYYEGQKNLG